jgi:hypothetical protein
MTAFRAPTTHARLHPGLWLACAVAGAVCWPRFLPAAEPQAAGTWVHLQTRASALDPRAKPHPEIDFVFEKNGKPEDVEHASFDPAVQSRSRLVVWLMGYNQDLFRRVNSYGLHAVQPHYANKWFGVLKPTDRMARGNVRLEAATGEDVSDQIDIPGPDSMVERVRVMLHWLTKASPQGKWGQFLSSDGKNVRWEKVIIAGASHGATTAARFAKRVKVARVVMLCGPRDQDQDWQAIPSETPPERYFGFSHVLDGGWSGDHYCRSWELLGMNAFGRIVNVDETPAPFGNSRRLVSAADVGGNADKAHGAVQPGKSSPQNAQGEFLYEPVWKYLFTHPVDAVGEAAPPDPDCQQEHPLGK